MPTLDIYHIRNNPELYAETCLLRNYPNLASNPFRITKLMFYHQALQEAVKSLRERANALENELLVLKEEGRNIEESLKEVREIKLKILEVEEVKVDIMSKIEDLALALPNITSKETPRGLNWDYICSVNADEKIIQIKDRKRKPIHHVDIGKQLGIIEFASAANASGSGWCYLVGAGATGTGPRLLRSLLHDSRRLDSPQASSGEQQVYNIAQDEKDKTRGVPGLSLTGTSGIALAGMVANKIISEEELPLRRVAASRCYRPDTGLDTEGLYNVNEFTNVELFAWTKPDEEEMEYFFDEIIDIQTDILGALGITCRVLDMPVHYLRAREARRVAIKAFFPFRAVGKTPDEVHDAAWGEIASSHQHTKQAASPANCTPD
ncbi:seryl-tRNA synthetase [Fusarium proliferatum]|nr:seryl-tRNA synthetase [Fusarium proliferatum]